MKLNNKSNSKAIGKVTYRLFDGKKLEAAKIAAANGANLNVVERLIKEATKPIFKGNAVWRFLNKLTGEDFKIPFITGVWTTKPIIMNTVTDVGKKHIADQLGGTVTTPATAIAIGTGTPTTTALGSEISTSGGSRGAATVTNETTTTTGDTERWQKTFNLTGTLAITEEGIFNNNTSGGVMVASQSFPAINVVNGDALQVTHDIQIT